MARRALSPACLALVQAVEGHVPAGLAATGATRLAVGLSGGADSLALAGAVAWAVHKSDSPLSGLIAGAHVIDHDLQPGSAAVAAEAARAARRLGLADRISQVSVLSTGSGWEADARAARYAALLADPDRVVLVAHTRDDQAETVLLGLARGSGTRSLAGMPARAGRLVRPFLDVPRSVTAQACADWGLRPWEDPMNSDPAYARVRARAALATLDRQLGPGLPEALARTARLAAADADYLDALAEDAQAGVAIGPGLGVTRLAQLATALRGRVLLAWLRQHGGDVGLAHVSAVERLVTDWHGQAGVDVPGGRVVRRDGRLLVEPA
jgi:tRNA(Ile)-lysidine synthase